MNTSPTPFSAAQEKQEHALDNVVWSALSGPHAAFAAGDEVVKRYPPDVAPFCAVHRPDPASLDALAASLRQGESAALVTAARLDPFGGLLEISAVCVAPQCRGRGYAAALIKRLATAMLARGETPFLHVLRENASAIARYERLGFSLRQSFNLGVFKAA